MGGVIMITITISRGGEIIYKREIDNIDDLVIESIIEEINKAIDVGRRYMEAKSEYNKESVKEMVDGKW